jgi:hypothetical protein
MGMNLSMSSRALHLACAFVLAGVMATTAGPPSAAMAATAAVAECGGTLAFGEIAVCPSITDDRRDTFTVTTTKPDDKLYTMLGRSSGDSVQVTVNGPDGAQVCFIRTDADSCQLGAAGKYTITVSLRFGGTGNYSLSVQSLLTPSVCTTLASTFFSFAATGFPGNLRLGSSGDCFRFNQPVGSVVYLWDPNSSGDVQGQILDAQLQPVCTVRYATYCTLGTAGPYRLQLFEYYGNPVPYTLRLSRISNAAGCSPLSLAQFGDPGDAVGTGSLAAQDAIACHRIHMPSAGTVAVRIHNQQNISSSIYNQAGQLLCQLGGFPIVRSCHLPAEGNYFIITLSRFWEPIDYQIAVPALFRNAGCATGTGLSWALDATLVHQTSPVQTNCQPFSGNAGDRVMVYRAPVVYNEIISWLVDSTGEPLCTSFSDADGCVLPATGRYRVISHALNWDPAVPDVTYKMQVRRLSQPAGCPVVQPGAYDAAPAGALGPIRCRILDISTPGKYIARAFDPHNNQTFAAVYDTAGNRVCDDSSFCDIAAAGRYTMVLNARVASSVLDNDFSFVTTLLPYLPSGCATTPDTGHLEAPLHAEFTSAGQFLCRELTSPAGARIVTFQPTEATGPTRPNVYVLDSTGAFVCETFGLRQSSCQLNGTAPFFAVFSAQSNADPAAFVMAFARMDNAPACPVLPRDAVGSTVTTGGDRFVACFSIPADQHAARETFTWRRLSGGGNASLSVFNDTGLRYCQVFVPTPERTFNCTGPTGAWTVILETGGPEATYQVTHRDGTIP